MIKMLLSVGDFIAAYGEMIFAICGATGAVGLIVQHKKLSRWWLLSWAPLTVCAVIITQAPWRLGEFRVIGKRAFAGTTVAITQYNDGPGECITVFRYRDQAGLWSEYMMDYDNVRWSSVGFRYVAPDRIDVTRWGLIVASFDPIHREFCRVSSGIVLDPIHPSPRARTGDDPEL